MICRWGFVLLLVCLAPLPGYVLAAEIVMVVTTTVTVSAQSVDVRLEVGNRGNADALVVTPFVALAGMETGLESEPYIAFKGKRAWTYSFPVSDLHVPEAGAYPLVVRLRYHDAHMYPYSMVSVTSVQVGESRPVEVPVAGAMLAEQGTAEGILDLRVTNTGDSPLEARLTMVSPAGLVLEGDGGKLNIPAGKEEQISYAIKNNGSLPGSRHNIYATIEYTVSGQHGVVILEEGVAVASSQVNKKRTIIIVSAGIIALLFFLVLFIELRAGVSTA